MFTESSGTWTQQAKLSPSDGQAALIWFGFSVALAGTTALVSAPSGNSTAGDNTGVVYVFDKSGDTWVQTQKFAGNDSAWADYFGYSVAASGTTAVVGAAHKNVGTNSAQGVAYVFSGSGGAWVQTGKLIASDGGQNDQFGNAVAVSGSTALVGAWQATIGDDFAQGAAYVFSGSGGAWTQTAKLTEGAGETEADDEFGFSVALDGTRAIVGAPLASVVPFDRQGLAYVFDGSSGVWTQTRKFVARDGATENDFGAGVAIDGTTALVGADYITIDQRAQGAAYFYGLSDLDLVVSAPETVGQKQNYVSQAIATNKSDTASPAVSVTVAVPAAASFVSADATKAVAAKIPAW